MIGLEDIQAILRGIWRGNVNVNTLPKKVYDENRNRLNNGVEKGFGSKLNDFNQGTQEFRTMQSLHDNVTFFSAAKTFQQVNDMQFERFDENGFLRSFNDFKKEALPIFNKYNVDWLETEWNTSVSQSQSAEQWIGIQANKKDLPLLQYRTANDARVRDAHKAWDGIIRPVGDPFWDTRLPNNGYNCRCIVIQLPGGDSTNLNQHLIDVNKQRKIEGIKPLSSLKNEERLFADNVGKSEQVFKETGNAKHPYFDAPQRRKDNNFGL